MTTIDLLFWEGEKSRPFSLRRPCPCGCNARDGRRGAGYLTGSNGGFTLWIGDEASYLALEACLCGPTASCLAVSHPSLPGAVIQLLQEHEDHGGSLSKHAWEALRQALVQEGYAERCPHGSTIPLGEQGACGCSVIAEVPVDYSHHETFVVTLNYGDDGEENVPDAEEISEWVARALAAAGYPPAEVTAGRP